MINWDCERRNAKTVLEEEKKQKEKYCVGIDRLKFFLIPFACINALGLWSVPEGYYIEVVSGFAAPCFYIICGFLVLSRDKERRREKLFRGMKRAALLFLLMMFLYVPANILFYSLDGASWLQEIGSLKAVFNFVFLSDWPFFIGKTIWFIQALLYTYAFLLLINNWFEKALIRRVLLVLSILFMLITTEFAGALNIQLFGMTALPAGMLTRAMPYVLIGGLLRERVEKLFAILPVIFPILAGFFVALSLGEFSLLAMLGVFVDDSHCISLGLAAIALACWAIVTPEAEGEDLFSVNGRSFSKWIYVAFPLAQFGIDLLARLVAPNLLGDIYDPDGLIVYVFCLMVGICISFLTFRISYDKDQAMEDQERVTILEENKTQNWDDLEVVEFKIRLAGRVIGITSMYESVRDICTDYLVDDEVEPEEEIEDSYVSIEDAQEDEENPGAGANRAHADAVGLVVDQDNSESRMEDFHVTTTQDDIEFEREKSIREAKAEGEEPREYSDGYLEMLAVYRKIAMKMLAYDTWLMHGAVVGVEGEAVLFAAPSGVGKTTHLRLWLENIPGAFVVNGDKPLLRLDGDVCMVYGTPWAGKEGMQTNVALPLRAVCFLERGKTDQIEKISFADAYPLLLQQSYRSSNAKAMEKTLGFLQRVCMTVPMYRLHCTMDANAAKIAYEEIYGKKL